MLYYFTENKKFFYIDRIFFIYFSFLVFSNNFVLFADFFKIFVIFVLLVLAFYVCMFLLYRKKNKEFILNFKKLSCFTEMFFISAVVLFGIKSQITEYFLLLAASDVIYKVLILELILHLRKRTGF